MRKVSTSSQAEATTAAIPGLAIPADARAVLVTERSDGTFRVKPVAHGASVLNIERELLDHLTAYPFTDEWLATLGEYCTSRLRARAEARGTGRVVIPATTAAWNLMDLASLPTVNLEA